ncbi:MAG TPA: chloride channel protein, partial [Solirubrobacteraceae bacterium]|nr:chloride channel protein [Solirubrobacteraceae bacterium]
LFIGAMLGMAFGTVAHHLFGPAIGAPAMYAVVAMGGVFAAAAQAPLTAIASVVEMTGNFGLTLPIMLATGIAAAVSKQLSYGSIYTTKLLRRGIDIERPRITNMLATLTVAGVMRSIPQRAGDALLVPWPEPGVEGAAIPDEVWETLAGPVTDIRQPQELFGDETLEQALRQLTLYDHEGLPVISHDGQRLEGWITRQDVLQALAKSVSSSARDIERGAIAADFAEKEPEADAHKPSAPLKGYEIVEITVSPESPALGHRVGDVAWPPGSLIVAITKGHNIVSVGKDIELHAGERIILLAPTGAPPRSATVPPAVHTEANWYGD